MCRTRLILSCLCLLPFVVGCFDSESKTPKKPGQPFDYAQSIDVDDGAVMEFKAAAPVNTLATSERKMQGCPVCPRNRQPVFVPSPILPAPVLLHPQPYSVQPHPALPKPFIVPGSVRVVPGSERVIYPAPVHSPTPTPNARQASRETETGAEFLRYGTAHGWPAAVDQFVGRRITLYAKWTAGSIPEGRVYGVLSEYPLYVAAEVDAAYQVTPRSAYEVRGIVSHQAGQWLHLRDAEVRAIPARGEMQSQGGEQNPLFETKF